MNWIITPRVVFPCYQWQAKLLIFSLGGGTDTYVCTPTYILFWDHTRGAQVIFLALCSGISPGGAQGCYGLNQGKCLIDYSISPILQHFYQIQPKYLKSQKISGNKVLSKLRPFERIPICFSFVMYLNQLAFSPPLGEGLEFGFQ